MELKTYGLIFEATCKTKARTDFGFGHSLTKPSPLAYRC